MKFCTKYWRLIYCMKSKIWVISSIAGADLGFSRAVGFSKNFRKFWRHLFLVDHIDFPSSPEELKRRCFGQTFCAAGKFLKTKQIKKAVFGHFLESFDKKSCYFLARASLKILIYWRQRRLQKQFRVGQPKMDFPKSTKVGPFGSAGGRIPEKCPFSPPPPPP